MPKIYLERIKEGGGEFYCGTLGLEPNSIKVWVHYSLPRRTVGNPYIELPLVNARLTRGNKSPGVIIRHGLSNVFLVTYHLKCDIRVETPVKKSFKFRDHIEQGQLIESEHLELLYHWFYDSKVGTCILKATGVQVDLDPTLIGERND